LQSTQDTDFRYDPRSPMRVFNIHWYKDQMTGWMTSSYILLTFGILFLLVTGLYHHLTLLGITSTLAGIIGFTCTLSITNGKPINGILGFVSAIMLIYVASLTGNFSDVVMQAAYIFLLDIPVIFNKNWNSDQELEPRRLNRKFIAQTAAVFLVFWALTYGLDTVILTSPRPLIDSISATFGLTGAVLTVRRFRASYYFWLAQSLLSIILWSVTAMAGHPVWVLFFTYCLYILNDVVALTSSKWFK
jgi:nicotinamide mononucleotide transporter